MIFHNKILGVLIVKNYLNAEGFKHEDKVILEVIAGQLAPFLKNIGKFENIGRSKDREHRIKEFTSRIRHENDMHAIVELAAIEIRNTLNLVRAKIDIDVETALPSTFHKNDVI
jgi:hypothetical protein